MNVSSAMRSAKNAIYLNKIRCVHSVMKVTFYMVLVAMNIVL